MAIIGKVTLSEKEKQSVMFMFVTSAMNVLNIILTTVIMMKTQILFCSLKCVKVKDLNLSQILMLIDSTLHVLLGSCCYPQKKQLVNLESGSTTAAETRVIRNNILPLQF